MPVFSVDKEKENGIHTLATDFYAKIGSANLIVISFAEHKGNYATAFKNVLDWTSRINTKTFQEKEMLLLATSLLVFVVAVRFWILLQKDSVSRRNCKRRFFFTKFQR